MTAWRMVMRQGDEERVGSAVFSEEKMIQQIRDESWLYLVAGWTVTVGIGKKTMVAVKGNRKRELFFRKEEM